MNLVRLDAFDIARKCVIQLVFRRIRILLSVRRSFVLALPIILLFCAGFAFRGAEQNTTVSAAAKTNQNLIFKSSTVLNCKTIEFVRGSESW